MADYTIFGLPGSPIIRLLHDIDIEKLNINFINLGHEDLNGHAAQTYSNAHPNRLPGTLLCTHGPGLASCINSIANAKKENNPLVIISVYEKPQEGPRQTTRDFQYWDTIPILSSIIGERAIHTIVQPTPSRAENTFTEAYMQAYTIKGPVALLFDTTELGVSTNNYISILKKALETIKNTFVTPPSPRVRSIQNSPTTPHESTIVIIDKHTVPQAVTIKKLIETHPGLNYITTFAGRVNFNLSSNQFLGIIGSENYTSVIDAVLSSCKTIIILCYDEDSEKEGPGFFHKKYGIPMENLKDKKVIKISEQELTEQNGQGILTGKYHKYSSINIKTTLPPQPVASIHTPSPMQMSHLNDIYWTEDITEAYTAYCRRMPELHENHIVIGIGDFAYAIGNLIVPSYPSHFFSSTKWGSIGIAVPNSMGACAAIKDTRPAKGTTFFLYEGDGSLLWASPAFLTMHANITKHFKNVTFIVTVFCNNSYGAVKEGMEKKASSFKTQDTAYSSVEVPVIPTAPLTGTSIYTCNNSEYYKQIIEGIASGRSGCELHVIYCYIDTGKKTHSGSHNYISFSSFSSTRFLHDRTNTK